MSSDQKTTATTSTDEAPAFQLNLKKLKELSEQASAIKIGGKVSGLQSRKKNDRPSSTSFHLGHSTS